MGIICRNLVLIGMASPAASLIFNTSLRFGAGMFYSRKTYEQIVATLSELLHEARTESKSTIRVDLSASAVNRRSA